MIGPFGLFAPDGTRIEITSQRGAAMLAFLALGPDGVRARRRIEAMLWGGRGHKQAQDSLRRELSNMRRVLRAVGAEHILVPELRRVTLALDQVEVDLIELARGRSQENAGGAGEFMEGLDLADADEFEEWLREQRERTCALFEGLPGAASPTPAAPPRGSAPLAARPSPKPALAVLPFASVPESECDTRGLILSEMLALCLSEFPQLLVISTNAAADAALRLAKREALAAELQVQYLVEGTVFARAHSGEGNGGVRVFSKIIDGANGEQVWSGVFDGAQDMGLTLERAIAEAIAPQIWTGIDLNERRRVLQLRVPSHSSYDRYWQANALYRSWRAADLQEAARIARALVEDEPNCPWANSLAAFCQAAARLFGRIPDPAAAGSAARSYLATALRTGADNLEALGYCAGTLLLLGEDFEEADRIISRALAIMPSHQPALLWGGWVDVLRNDGARALERFALAMRINPTSNARGEAACGMALAHLAQGDWQSARARHAQAQRDAPGFPLVDMIAPMIAAAERDPQNFKFETSVLAVNLRILPELLGVSKRG